jgi:hypothetical protein
LERKKHLMTGLMKDSSVRWVGAADRRPNACLIAVTAMIVGKPYEQVAAEIGQAMTDPVLRRYFAVCGFAVAEFPKWDLFSSHDPAEGAVPGDLLIEGTVFPQRAVWPLDPFAPIHLCITGSASAESAHAVILLGNGDVDSSGFVGASSDRAFQVVQAPQASAQQPRSRAGHSKGFGFVEMV